MDPGRKPSAGEDILFHLFFKFKPSAGVDYSLSFILQV